MADVSYSLKDLVSLASIAENMPLSERLARQYITDGLIGAPRVKGGGMAYGAEHLLQLRLVMRLAAQYVQARDIQMFLNRLSPEGVHALVDNPLPPRSPSEGDANAYLIRLSRGLPPAPVTRLTSREIAPPHRPSTASPRPRGLPAADSAVTSVRGPRSSIERTSWLRATVDAEVEIYVRVLAGDDRKRLVDALVAAVQDVLAADRGTEL